MGDRQCLSMCEGEEGGGVILCRPVLSQNGESSWRMGGRLPRGRVLGAPLPLSAPPPCATSHSVPPNSQLMQGLPQFRGFGVQGAVSPLVCAQVTPDPSVIRAVGRDFFLPWNLSLSFTLPPTLGSSLMQMCHHGGHGWSREGSPAPGSQRQWAEEILPPFPAPSLSLIKTCL